MSHRTRSKKEGKFSLKLFLFLKSSSGRAVITDQIFLNPPSFITRAFSDIPSVKNSSTVRNTQNLHKQLHSHCWTLPPQAFIPKLPQTKVCRANWFLQNFAYFCKNVKQDFLEIFDARFKTRHWIIQPVSPASQQQLP